MEQCLFLNIAQPEMDELLEDLGVSYDDLYKLHTGHHINNESDGSDSSDDSSSLDENLKPPPYSLHEINQNKVIVEAQIHTESSENCKSTGTPEDVARKLSLYITRDYCFICNKHTRRNCHYRRSKHFLNVRRWLQQELAKVLGGVQLNIFFCEVCNLALSGNGLSQKHYESEGHKSKAKNFCHPCLRSIPEHDMTMHIQSKKHKNASLVNSQLLRETNIELKLDTRDNESTIPDESIGDDQHYNSTWPVVDTECENIEDHQQLFHHISNSNAINNKSIKNNCLGSVCTANNDRSNPNKCRTLTEFGALANIIMDLLTPSFCYVCNTMVKRSHYNTREHNKALEKWIENYTETFGFYIKNIDDLICFPCHAVFPKKKCAKIHYESSGHERKAKHFCNICLQRCFGSKSEDHDKEKAHIAEEQRKKEKERNLITIGESHPMNLICSEIFIQHNKSSDLKIHGIDVNLLKDIIEDKMNITAQCEPIAKTIIELLTPIYCFMCNKSALRNNKGLFKHYTYMGHIRELQKRLHIEAEAFGSEQINYESLYCEACDELFLNLKLAEQHYNTSRHKKNCDICKIHGPNIHFAPIMNTEEVRQPELLLKNEILHGETRNFDSKTNGYVTSDSEYEQTCYTSLNNNSQMNKKEKDLSSPTKEHPGSIIAAKLTDMLTPTFCYICKRNVNMHIFNHHYLEREHTIKLRNWLEQEIKKSGVKIAQNTIYCEDCTLELGGTSEDLKHYDTVTHQLNKNKYCSVCVFRGTPDDVIQHTSTKQHKDNFKKSFSSVKKANVQHTSWPRKLTKLITLNECKVCCLKLETLEKADFHYCSERHNISVENWLDHYYQFGDSAVNIANENLKKVSCAFCGSSFSSEQELNDHNNSHFPALDGVNGRDSPKKPRTKNGTSKSKKQKVLTDDVVVDKQILTTTEQQGSKNEKKNNNSNDNYIKLEMPLAQQTYEKNSVKNDDSTKMYEEIRLEIIRLINSVYFSKALSLEQSLFYLKDLNEKLLDAKRMYKDAPVHGTTISEGFEQPCTSNKQVNKPNSTGAVKKIIVNGSSQSHNNDIVELGFLNMVPNHVDDITEHEYAKMKLSMELQRLKLVIGNTNKIPTDLALKYVQNLNQLLESSVNTRSRDFDINGVFEARKNTFIQFSRGTNLQNNLTEEMDRLSGILLDVKKVNVELALDFITRFNVQLESLLQHQEGNAVNLFDY